MSVEVPLKELLARHTRESAPELTKPMSDGAVRCVACAHRCVVRPERAGICRVRFNKAGKLRVPWGYVAGLQVDPIEKKPFYHAFPGRDALSFGMLGCDLHCSFCQNWVSSQALRDERAVAQPNFRTAEQLVELAVEHGAPAMVSTYNEPLITADWAVEVFKLARQRGIVCGFVSNGNASAEVLDFLRPHMDLLKIDLKGFDDRRYRRLGGVLDNVLSGIRMGHKMGFWIEVVTLLVPGFNDRDDEIRRLAEFIATVSIDIPWHITAFHPDYKLTGPSRTPIESLLRAHELGKAAGLRHVYAGNAAGSVGDREHTYCPECSAVLIRRLGFAVTQNNMRGSCCSQCGAKIAGVWEDTPPPKRKNTSWPTALRMC